jgi:protein-disulfide isomerase
MEEKKKNFLFGFSIGLATAFFIALVVLSGAYYKNIIQADKADAEKEVAGQVKAVQQVESPAVKTDIKVVAGDWIKGDKNALITIFEFSDFQCPFCSRFHSVLDEALKKYPKDIKVVFKHLPLAMHSFSESAALAAECAGEQGKFSEYGDALFASQSKINTAFFSYLAKELELDSEKFDKCLNDKKYSDRVKADQKMATDNGVKSTPTWFINGEKMVGAVSFEKLETMIADLLR